MRQITPALLVSALLIAGCTGTGDTDPDAADPTTPAAGTSAPVTSETDEPTESDEPTETEAAEATETGAEESDDSEAAAEEVVITIASFAYEVPDTIAPGTEVTVVNTDAVMHTVTSDEEGLFDVSVDGGSEATFTVPDEPGDYSFFCRPHPNMVDTLVVG
ncbi:cupredoxin domain-containing protein [Serinicoccus kebangsaanensis]|uniref:cupredoxin domain-containing protein n=1 Tax=Serinicoccus kebangsaanensis TaxID=2602069 RepID=UPI00124CD810|nr:cupredoxin domain-containing protein [Serinicoccus kebangsaanensis]